MVHAPVQKGPVVGHQQKAPLPPQVLRHRLPSPGVQVVGGLVDQQVPLLPAEQRRQQRLGPLSVGEGGKGPVQRLGLYAQQPRLPQQLPLLRRGGRLLEHLQGHAGRVPRLMGEVRAGRRAGNPSAAGILPQQQAQKGGLPPAVAAQEAQLPASVKLKAHIFKYVIVAARIGKGQVFHPNHGHMASLQTQKQAAGKSHGPRRNENAPLYQRASIVRMARKDEILSCSRRRINCPLGTFHGAFHHFSRKQTSSFHSSSSI